MDATGTRASRPCIMQIEKNSKSLVSTTRDSPRLSFAFCSRSRPCEESLPRQCASSFSSRSHRYSCEPHFFFCRFENETMAPREVCTSPDTRPCSRRLLATSLPRERRESISRRLAPTSTTESFRRQFFPPRRRSSADLARTRGRVRCADRRAPFAMSGPSPESGSWILCGCEKNDTPALVWIPLPGFCLENCCIHFRCSSAP